MTDITATVRQLLIFFVLLTSVHRECFACVRVVPTPSPSPAPSIPQEPTTTPGCPCPPTLYSLNICPAIGECYREITTAVTYTTGLNCAAISHCPSDWYVRFFFPDGTHLDNLLVRDITSEKYRMECRNGRWILTGTRFASGKEFTHLVCYKEAIVQNFANIPRSHASRTCKLCSPIENVPESGLCPPGFRCSRPSIESVIGSSNCGRSKIECPGSDLVVQLSSGLSAIVYPQDVYCDETWIYDDGLRKHQIVNMLCLSKE